MLYRGARETVNHLLVQWLLGYKIFSPVDSAFKNNRPWYMMFLELG